MGFNLKKIGAIASPITGGLTALPLLTEAGKTGPNVSGNLGSYGEGNVALILKNLQDMKAAVQSGSMSLSDYQQQAAPLVTQAASLTGQISKGGSSAANAVNPIWQSIQDGGFATPVNGKWTAPLPFSKQEYAKLPNNVLPTQDDINKGLFDPNNAPLQRLQSAPTPTDGAKPPTPDANGTTPASVTPNNQVGGSPVFSANPNDPSPAGGLTSSNTAASADAQRIAQEAALQQQLSVQNQQGITSQRQSYLNDLTGLLNKNTQQQMSNAAPGIYEDVNTRGLLHSSGLGDALANKSQQLQADTTNQLAQYGLQGETSDLGNYNTIQNNYNQQRNSALSREYSVEDYNSQLQAGKSLGDQYASLKPQTPSTKDTLTTAAAPSVLPAAAKIATK